MTCGAHELTVREAGKRGARLKRYGRPLALSTSGYQLLHQTRNNNKKPKAKHEHVSLAPRAAESWEMWFASEERSSSTALTETLFVNYNPQAADCAVRVTVDET